MFTSGALRRYMVIITSIVALSLIFMLNAHRHGQIPVTAQPAAPPQQQHQQPPQLQQQQQVITQCPTNVDWLRNGAYGLTDKVLFQRRRITGKRTANLDRNIMQHEPEPIVGITPAEIDIQGCEGWAETNDIPITLNVSRPYHRVTHEHIILGVGTTFERLANSMQHFVHWMHDTDVRLVAVLIDAPSHINDLPGLEDAFAANGIELLINGPWNDQLGPNEHHFTILRNLLWYATPETKWVGIIDDDTFFPSLYPLTQELEKLDPSKYMYVGGLTENSFAIQKHGVMAYGGAGVFLSLPLARDLSPWVERCLEDTPVTQGDGLLQYCMDTHAPTEFTTIDGLHQIDVAGDASGFYEGGKNLISLHHWKSWHHAPVLEMSKISDYCGDCFLQRWAVGNHTLFTNGYSLTVYDQDLKDINLEQVEDTWGEKQLFEWSLGTMRDPITAKRFHLIDSTPVQNNKLRQVYVHRAKQGREPMTADEKRKLKDEVIELLWAFED